jgi:hypothetical protein
MSETPALTALGDDWEANGSLRDVYVFDTTIEDWERALAAVNRTGWRQSYEESGVAAIPPPTVDRIFERAREGSVLLRVWPSQRVCANCHFFTPEEIELDLDPREVTDQASLDDVCELVRVLGQATGKTVVVTHENVPAAVIMEHDPISNVIRPSR